MSRPVFLSENLFNERQFPDHTIDAEEEPTGYEAWRVATGRRSGIHWWEPTTANSDTYIDVTCDRVRAADLLVIDRGHNLANYDFEIRGSQDDFTTYETVLDTTIPAVSTPGTLDDGVLTEEGVYIRRVDLRGYKYWRPFIPAMGAGLKPKIVGLYLGLSYSPEHLDMPLGVDADTMIVAETQSEAGWLGRGSVTQRREDTINLRLSNFTEYDQARYHIQGLYGAGFPMWYIPDDEQADQAMCIVRPAGGSLGFYRRTDYGYAQASFAYLEHEPLRA